MWFVKYSITVIYVKQNILKQAFFLGSANIFLG